MKKLYFCDIIEKYHLGGLVEKIKISVNNKTLTTKFVSINKNLVGEMSAPNIELEDCEFGIYDTSQLLKLINITDKLITLGIEKKGKTVTKLSIADAEYNLEYVLADLMLTPSVPEIDEPIYDMEATLNKDFIEKFVKAKRAIDSEYFSIGPHVDSLGNNALMFILGGDSGYNNKISFFIPSTKSLMINLATKFPLKDFNEILLSNKSIKSGNLFVSEQGLLKIEFENEEGVKVSYFLVGKE